MLASDLHHHIVAEKKYYDPWSLKQAAPVQLQEFEFDFILI